MLLFVALRQKKKGLVFVCFFFSFKNQKETAAVSPLLLPSAHEALRRASSGEAATMPTASTISAKKKKEKWKKQKIDYNGDCDDSENLDFEKTGGVTQKKKIFRISFFLLLPSKNVFQFCCFRRVFYFFVVFFDLFGFDKKFRGKERNFLLGKFQKLFKKEEAVQLLFFFFLFSRFFFASFFFFPFFFVFFLLLWLFFS